MKRLFLVLVVMVSFSTLYGQNKSQQKKIDYYVNSAETEFSLSKSQTQDLLLARNEYVSSYMAVMSDFKAGKITDEEKKNKLNTVNNDFNKNLTQITGKSQPEIQEFSKRMRQELKKI